MKPIILTVLAAAMLSGCAVLPFSHRKCAEKFNCEPTDFGFYACESFPGILADGLICEWGYKP